MRAGLGVPSLPEGHEPKGDMDVMLTMRAQGFISSPIPRRATLPQFGGLRPQTTSPSQPVVAPEPKLRSSPLSVRSQARSVSAFKGLFTGSTRPKSPPRSTSANATLQKVDDSFGAMGSNLLTMTKSNGSGDLGMPPTSMTSQAQSPSIPVGVTPKISIPSPIITSADQIVTGRSSVDWSIHTDTNSNRHTPTMPDGSLSPLQPPPHRKNSISYGPKPSNDGAIMYTHNGNGSVAGNFGLRTSPIEEVATLPPASPTYTTTSIGSPEQRGRAGSMTSVSTEASVELGGLNRRSRQAILPHPLTPPSRLPPAVPEAHPPLDISPISKIQTQHPYLRERSSSRSSSNNSPLSGASAQPSSSKRESDSSFLSTSTASTSHSRFSMPRRSRSQRRSMPPPPPRPAPNFAPPPPPSPRQTSLPPSPVTARPVKSTFRDSVAQQAIRLSLSSPKPPPSSSLPPRPDEKTYYSHRRTSSSGNKASATGSHPIPAFFPKPAGPRYPPPTGPLPPPPPALPAPVSRHASIKQRLRILSAPSSAPSVHSFTSSAHAAMHCFTPTSHAELYTSQPSTPIAEPITLDPNFLSFSSTEPEGEPEPHPRSPDRPPAPEPFPNSPEITSLSPPPRRGSRQITAFEKERLNAETANDKESAAEGTVKRASLSGSVVSFVAAS